MIVRNHAPRRRVAAAIVALAVVLGAAGAAWSQSPERPSRRLDNPLAVPNVAMPAGPASGFNQERLQDNLGAYRDGLANRLQEQTSNRMFRDRGLSERPGVR